MHPFRPADEHSYLERVQWDSVTRSVRERVIAMHLLASYCVRILAQQEVSRIPGVRTYTLRFVREDNGSMCDLTGVPEEAGYYPDPIRELTGRIMDAFGVLGDGARQVTEDSARHLGVQEHAQAFLHSLKPLMPYWDLLVSDLAELSASPTEEPRPFRGGS